MKKRKILILIVLIAVCLSLHLSASENTQAPAKQQGAELIEGQSLNQNNPAPDTGFIWGLIGYLRINQFDRNKNNDDHGCSFAPAKKCQGGFIVLNNTLRETFIIPHSRAFFCTFQV